MEKNSITDYLFIRYLMLRDLINNKYDVKNIIHFMLGFLAGMLGLAVYLSNNLIVGIIIIFVLSFANGLFHHFFSIVPHTEIVIDMEEEQNSDELKNVLIDTFKEIDHIKQEEQESSDKE